VIALVRSLAVSCGGGHLLHDNHCEARPEVYTWSWHDMAWSNIQPVMLALLAKRDQALRRALCQLTVHDCLRSSTIDHDCPWNVSYIPIYHIITLYYIYIFLIYYTFLHTILYDSYDLRSDHSGTESRGADELGNLAHFGCIWHIWHVLTSAYCIHWDRGKCLHAVLLRIQRLAHGFQADHLTILIVSVCV